ncbi:Hypothetical protein GLP15_3573 [Giardia lamblia P15]|uniref:Uncharacterized protein n=1 Tax=Giardia intestinalis (strain P15) TaxID=658858 RepID=E1F7H0_GIAIA|nr:Hypothetical protein GLP15_3573 [Giardia lamblia P15]
MHRPGKDLGVAIGFTVGAIFLSALTAGVIFTSSTTFSTLSTGDGKPPVVSSFDTYVSGPKSLYVWSHTTDSKIGTTPAWQVLLEDRYDEVTYLCTFCKQHGISEVYLFIGSAEWEWDEYFSNLQIPHLQAVRSAIAKLTAKKITTHPMIYLNDEPDNLSNYDRMEQIAEAVRLFKESNPDLLIGTLHIDQEPANPTAYTDYIRMLYLAAQKLPISVAIKPLWVRTELAAIEESFSLFDLALEIDMLLDIQSVAERFSDVVYYITSHATMMAYSNTKAQVESLATGAMDSAVRVGKQYAESAIEVGYTNNLPAEETLHYVLTGDKQGWFDSFLDLNTSFTKTAEERSLSHRTVIHDYSQYFYSLYCELPIAKPNIVDYPYKNCPTSKSL